MKPVPENASPLLVTLLADLLPASDETPSIDAPRLDAFAAQYGRGSTVAALLGLVNDECPDTPFADLDATARAAVLTRLRRKHLKAFTDFFLLAIQCYCLDPAVRQAFGDQPEAPFPEGRIVPDGCLELLEVVYQRGPVFREIATPPVQH